MSVASPQRADMASIVAPGALCVWRIESVYSGVEFGLRTEFLIKRSEEQ
jgi:hypothetical protein